MRKQDKTEYVQSHKKSEISECSSLKQYASEMSVFHLNIIFIYMSHIPVPITIHTTLQRSRELSQRFYKCKWLTIIKDVFCVGWSKQILRYLPLYSIVIMSNAIASGTASTTDMTQIRTISTAVHFGTPIPLMRLQEATARYLKQQHIFTNSKYEKIPV